MVTQEQILQLKKQIEESKASSSELKGRMQALLEKLEKDWGCSTIKQAEKKLGEVNQEIASLEKEKVQKIKELEEKFEF